MPVFSAIKVIDNLDVSAVVWQLTAGTKSIELIRASITSEQASNQQLSAYIARMASAGSGGTVITPRALVLTDPATVATATVKAGTFTANPSDGDLLYHESHNAMAGWHYAPVEDERIKTLATPSGGTPNGLIVRLANVPVVFDAVLLLVWKEK